MIKVGRRKKKKIEKYFKSSCLRELIKITCVAGVHGHLVFGGISNQPFGVGKGNIGGGSSVTLKNNKTIGIKIKKKNNKTIVKGLNLELASAIRRKK